MPESEKGIVVLGTPRSGTTLVRRILNAHPRIARPGATCVLSACARFLQSETVADGVEYGVISGLSFAGFSRSHVLSRLRAFAFGFHEDYASQQGQARWAEKTAVDIFHLDKMEAICAGSVRFVCVVRHGLDVVCSLQEFSNRGFTYLAEIHEYVKRYPRMLEAFAHAWVDANNALIDFVHRNPDNSLLIRYEDLIETPKKYTSEMFAFLNEDYSDELLDAAMKMPHSIGFGDWKTYARTNIDKVSKCRWKSLPPNTVSRLAEICNPTLEKLGYPPEEIRMPESEAIARRKFEIALAFGANVDKN